MKERKPFPVRKALLWAAAVLAGVLGGYLYYRFVGCATGTCPISSNPWRSSLYGGVIGGLLGYAFLPADRQKKNTQEEEPHA